jgi:hypothetical protein
VEHSTAKPGEVLLTNALHVRPVQSARKLVLLHLTKLAPADFTVNPASTWWHQTQRTGTWGQENHARSVTHVRLGLKHQHLAEKASMSAICKPQAVLHALLVSNVIGEPLLMESTKQGVFSLQIHALKDCIAQLKQVRPHQCAQQENMATRRNYHP